MDFAFCKERLSAAGVTFEPGLTADEILAIEGHYGFRFPADLRAFLEYALPVSRGWVNWRDGDPRDIQKRLDWPLEGICFDVEHNDFWWESWGTKPAAVSDACAIVKHALASAPRLIPICSHRYMPDCPLDSGNPVFSVYQTDIIYYGKDLMDYFCNEFGYWFGRADYEFDGCVRHIDFWSEIAG
jgi:hypothetical protein